MALLVDYDCSDDEDNVEENITFKQPIIKPIESKQVPQKRKRNDEVRIAEENIDRTFHPSSDGIMKPSQKEISIRPSKPKVVISLPSSAVFDEDFVPLAKKTTSQKSENSKLSFLPPPKCETVKSKPLIPRFVSQSAKVEQQQIDYNDDSDDSFDANFEESIDTEMMGSTNSQNTYKNQSLQYQNEDQSYQYENQSNYQSINANQYENQSNYQSIHTTQEPHVSSQYKCDYNDYPEQYPTALDPQSVQVASVPQSNQNKKFQNEWNRHIKSGAQFLDVDLGQHLKQYEAERLKAITQPVPTSVKAQVQGPIQGKKKHQITYLAQHAKSMQSDLENMWAANRATKKNCSKKYGF